MLNKKGNGFGHLFHLVGKMLSLIGTKLTMISIVSIIMFSAQNFFANYLIARCMASLLDVLLYGGEIWIPLISFLVSFAIFNITLALGFWGLQYVSTYGAKQVRLKVLRKALTVSADDPNLRDSSQLQSRLDNDVSSAVNLASFGPASWLMPYVAGCSSFVVICTIQPLLLIPVIVIAFVELFVNFKLAQKCVS